MNLKVLGPNQTEIEADGVCVLFSYNTPVAALIGGEYFATAKKHSATTSKHVNTWVGGVRTTSKPQEFFDGLLVAKKGSAL